MAATSGRVGFKAASSVAQWPGGAPLSLAAPRGERARDWAPKVLGCIPN